MASRDTSRGVSPVLRGVCANLLRKRGKAALSYSTPSPTPVPKATTGRAISCVSGVSGKGGQQTNERNRKAVMDKMDEKEKDQRQPLAVQETPYPDNTIGSLMAECEELEQYIASEKDSLERFMLETGGASDASDRIEERIDALKDMLAAAEGRLQALFDAQEREAFAPEKEAAGRTSVIKDLADRKAAAATRKPPEMKKERHSPGMER